jgi:hypothetical protein
MSKKCIKHTTVVSWRHFKISVTLVPHCQNGDHIRDIDQGAISSDIEIAADVMLIPAKLRQKYKNFTEHFTTVVSSRITYRISAIKYIIMTFK